MNISTWAKAACMWTAVWVSAMAAGGTVSPAHLSASIIDYGADPGGVQDSSPAFERMISAIGTNRHVQVIIPPGKFRLAKKVAFTADTNDEYYGLHIEGAGENVTEIIVDNAEGGIAFSGKEVTRLSVIVSDLSLVAGREGAGTALSFDTANFGVQNDRQFTARNITIRGERFDKGYFNTALHVRNTWYALFQNLNIFQQYGPAMGAKQHSMEYGMLLEDCYSPTVENCRVENSKYGLVQRAVKTEPEDGLITGSYFVGNVEGIVIDNKKNPGEWPEPGFHIENCHINYRDCGIRMNGVRQANISHTLFYCHDHTGTPWFKYETAVIPGGDETHPRDYEPRDIDLAHSSDIILDGNIFTEPANPNRVGVRIGPDSGSILISGNQFNMSGTAIKNESADPSYSAGNIFARKPGWNDGLKRYDDKPGKLVISDFSTPIPSQKQEPK
ncbi:MAG: right-handed parallel beta-helix repeat-containing protein [Kiritimatiellales bacterium]